MPAREDSSRGMKIACPATPMPRESEFLQSKFHATLLDFNSVQEARKHEIGMILVLNRRALETRVSAEQATETEKSVRK